MSETKHTPLPWSYHLGRGSHPRYHIQTTGGFQVAMTPDDTEWSERSAAFIVRACNAHYDLVEALQFMLGAFNVEEIDPLVAFMTIERARAILAKAKAQVPARSDDR